MQVLQQLPDEASQSTPWHEIVIVLHPGGVASSLIARLGTTLAGGADYETNEITVISAAISKSGTCTGCSPPSIYSTNNKKLGTDKKVEAKDKVKSIQTAVHRTVATRSVSAGMVEIGKPSNG